MYGFTGDLVTHGLLAVDGTRNGERGFRELEVELLAAAVRLAEDDELEVVVRGRWFFPTNPLTGQFPAHYDRSRRGSAALARVALDLPVIPLAPA